MASPFPGMNPYLEQDDAWQDFHDSFLPGLRAALTPQVSPTYIVKIEEHLFLHEPGEEERILIGYADVDATRSVQAPALSRIPYLELEKHIFLEIRDRKDRELVTVIELLSPSNKRPGNKRDQYLVKRGKVLRSAAHLVEIDLLRGWPRMPMDPLPGGDYCIMVSRVEDRPVVDIWPLQLRDPLPPIAVPLRAPSPDAVVELLPILHQVYDQASYKDYIYHGKPQPPLNPADQAWATAILGK